MKVLLCLLPALFLLISCHKDDPKSHPTETVYAVRGTSDGGFVIAGTAYTSGEAFHMLSGRFDRNGNAQWLTQGPFAGIGFPTAVQPTADGGLVVLGIIEGWGGPSHVSMFKADSSGAEQWVRPIADYFWHVGQAIPSADGGFVLTGIPGSGQAGGAVLLKLGAEGNTLVSRAYGDTLYGYAVAECPDGGFLIWEHSWSSTKSVWVRTDFGGIRLWIRPVSDSLSSVRAVVASSTGGFLVAGEDTQGHPFLERLDENADSVGAYTDAGEGTFEAHSLVASPDGGFVAACVRHAARSTTEVLKLDAQGQRSWATVCPGSQTSEPEISILPDGALILCGMSVLPADDENETNSNAYIAKLAPSGQLLWEHTFGD